MEKFLKKMITLVLLFAFMTPLMNNNVHACLCGHLSIMEGGGLLPKDPKERKKQLKMHRERFRDNFDKVIEELNKIFLKTRHLKKERGPDWFYRPIKDDQITELSEEMNKHLRGDGTEFLDNSQFWQDYKALRTPTVGNNGRLNDITGNIYRIEKHHIIPSYLGGKGNALNCIELYQDEHRQIGRFIAKVVLGQSLE